MKVIRIVVDIVELEVSRVRENMSRYQRLSRDVRVKVWDQCDQ